MQAPKPEEKTLNTPEVWRNLVKILSVRLALLSLMLAAATIMLPSYGGAFHAFAGLAFVLTIPYSLWIRDHVRLHDLAYLQFLVDLVLVTGFVYFTGGLNSGLILLYPLVIVAAGIVCPWQRAMQIAVLCVLAYCTLATLTLERVLVPYTGGEPAGDPRRALLLVFIHGITFLLFGAVSVFLSRRCLYLEPVEQSGELIRWRSAANMASEMAHEVRNPVAAISGCAQLLDHLEKRSARGDTRCAQTLREEREGLHQCIVDESVRLDRIIERFLDHAEFSEEKLACLMKMSELHPSVRPQASQPPAAEATVV